MSAESIASESTLKGISPQFLVDDLEASVAYYRDALGFDVDFMYESFYGAVSRNGACIHLKCATSSWTPITSRLGATDDATIDDVAGHSKLARCGCGAISVCAPP